MSKFRSRRLRSRSTFHIAFARANSVKAEEVARSRTVRFSGAAINSGDPTAICWRKGGTIELDADPLGEGKEDDFRGFSPRARRRFRSAGRDSGPRGKKKKRSIFRSEEATSAYFTRSSSGAGILQILIHAPVFIDLFAGPECASSALSIAISQ